MITKGIVEEIVSPYKAKVRLPIFDGIEGSQTALSTKDLSAATICTLPNLTSVVSVGDIVYVGFEDDDIARPVILGHLSKESGTDTKAILTLDGLNVEGITQLSEQTNIGKVKPTEIARLTGVKANVQDQLNNLSQYTPLLSELEINTRNLLILEDSDTLSAGISIRTSFADQSFSISGRNETMLEFSANLPIKPIQLIKGTEYLFSLQNISNAIPTVSLDLRSSNSAIYIEPGRPYKATDNVIIDKLHVTVFGTRQISSTLYMMFEQGSTLHNWVKPGVLVYSIDPRLQNVAHTTDPEIVFAESERQKSKNLLNGIYFENAWVNEDGSVKTQTCSMIANLIKLQPNTQYTYSVNTEMNYMSITGYDVNGSITRVIANNPNVSSITFTTTSVEHYVTVTIELKGRPHISANEIMHYEPQIELGPIRTTYEPCGVIAHKNDPTITFAERERLKTLNLFNYDAQAYKVSIPGGGTIRNNYDGSFTISNMVFYYPTWNINVNLKPNTEYTISETVTSVSDTAGLSQNGVAFELVVYYSDGSYSATSPIYISGPGRYTGHFTTTDKTISAVEYRALRKNNNTSTLQGVIKDVSIYEGKFDYGNLEYNGPLINEKYLNKNYSIIYQDQGENRIDVSKSLLTTYKEYWDLFNLDKSKSYRVYYNPDGTNGTNFYDLFGHPFGGTHHLFYFIKLKINGMDQRGDIYTTYEILVRTSTNWFAVGYLTTDPQETVVFSG
jgi:hypothetical protein